MARHIGRGQLVGEPHLRARILSCRRCGSSRTAADAAGDRAEMTGGRTMPASSFSRRRFLKTTALTAASTLAAPYMRTAHSAGRLRLGCWDHWVPGANDTLTAICNEWGAKNHVEVHIDYITPVGDKDILPATPEALAKTGPANM